MGRRSKANVSTDSWPQAAVSPYERDASNLECMVRFKDDPFFDLLVDAWSDSELVVEVTNVVVTQAAAFGFLCMSSKEGLPRGNSIFSLGMTNWQGTSMWRYNR